VSAAQQFAADGHGAPLQRGYDDLRSHPWGHIFAAISGV
jgi:hypothetical protein